MKKLNKIGWLILLIGAVVIWGFAAKEQSNQLIKQVIVEINATKADPFLDKKDVLDLVQARHDTLVGKPLKDLRFNEIETLLKQEPGVKNAEAFAEHKGIVHLQIELKKVIARLKPDTAVGFYIDTEGQVMPWISKHTPRVLTVTGDLLSYKRFLKDSLVEQSLTTHSKLVRDVYAFAQFVNADEFWSALIGQVYINNEGDAILIPLVGKQEIVFGELTDFEKKFKKIKKYYTEIAPKMGWEKYREVNVKFEQQIVCK